MVLTGTRRAGGIAIFEQEALVRATPALLAALILIPSARGFAQERDSLADGRVLEEQPYDVPPEYSKDVCGRHTDDKGV